MKESFVTPLLLALLFVGTTLGISSVSISERNQLAQVAGTNSATVSTTLNTTTANLPVVFSVSVSSEIVCTSAHPTRTVGFFTNPVSGGYFSIYGAGGTDMGDREPGLYDLPVGTYTWEGIARTGYVRSGTYTGSFTVSGTCNVHTDSSSTTTTTAPPPPPPPATVGTETANLRGVSVTVSSGTACIPDKRMTQVAIATEPKDGAKVVIVNEKGNVVTTATQGLLYLPNGAYTWTAEAQEGFSVIGASSGSLSLAYCPTVLRPSVAVGAFCDPVEEGVPVTFGLSGEGKAYFSLKNTVTGETVPLEPGTEYLPNGSYVWTTVTGGVASVEFDGATSGTFTVSSCKVTATTPYVAPKAGTLLFFREGKLIEPIVRQREKIAVRVDLSGMTSVELERVGKDTREILGSMIKDTGTTRWLFAWDVGETMPGEYDLIVRAKGAKGESVSGSRLVNILPSLSLSVPLPLSPLTSSARQAPAEEFPPLSEVSAPEEPLFTRLEEERDHDASLSLPVRGVADLISTEDILAAKGTLPDAIRSPEDLRVFCSTENNDDVCFEFIPEALRKEARETVEEARKEIARAFDERPTQDTDTDTDGITDFDETHFYGTDPLSADSDGDGKKDQEELRDLHDPLRKTTVPTQVIFESPLFGGEERSEFLAVEDIRIATGTLPKDNVLPLVLSGKALPGTIVTIYIYSDPIIVRVKADESGLWSYTLTKELPDGSHKAYVAMTDSAGRVLAKSAPLPFVKEAAAVSITSSGLPGTSPSAPSLFSGTSLYAIILITLGVLGFALLSIGVIVRSRRDESVIP